MTRFTGCVALCLIAGLAPPGAVAATTADNLPDAVAKLISADRECIDRDASHLMASRTLARLDENNTLYLLPCFTGAYNVVYRVYVFDARYPDELRESVFAGYSDENGWYGKRELINATFDAGTKTLTAFEKGRGLGDCGSVPAYRWNVYDWRMIEYRHWGKCDGSRMPEQWFVIYRHTKTAR